MSRRSPASSCCGRDFGGEIAFTSFSIAFAEQRGARNAVTFARGADVLLGVLQRLSRR